MRIFRFASLLLIAGLIAAPAAASSAAASAAMLWWTRVVPSLLPYLIASSLLVRSGLLSGLSRRTAPLLLLFGALGGYPVGARLASELHKSGQLTLPEAQTAALCVNLPNPVFLLSVVAAGMFSDARAAIPLLLAIYGVALFGVIPLSRLPIETAARSSSGLSPTDLPDAIADGVHAILNVGGCILFASVLGALLHAAGTLLFRHVDPAAHAVFLGLFEMTCGCEATAALALSLRLRLALCAFFIQFGGASVFLQAASALPLSRRVLLGKLCMALASGLLAFLLTPLFCPESVLPTLAGGRQIAQNAASFLIVAASAAVGLLFVFVLTFGLSKRKKDARRRP